MKLLISKVLAGEILAFAAKHDARAMFEELKITIALPTVSIVFFQPERYSRLVLCYLDFGNDINFFFEEARKALDEVMHSQQPLPDNHCVSDDVLTRNDCYVHHVLQYCEKNFDLVTAIPPCWFERAMSISDAATRKNFPDLADEDTRKKQNLLNSWHK